MFRDLQHVFMVKGNFCSGFIFNHNWMVMESNLDFLVSYYLKHLLAILLYFNNIVHRALKLKPSYFCRMNWTSRTLRTAQFFTQPFNIGNVFSWLQNLENWTQMPFMNEPWSRFKYFKRTVHALPNNPFLFTRTNIKYDVKYDSLNIFLETVKTYIII